MGSLAWVFGGVVSILIGLTIWYTAFVLVPLGVIFVLVGIVTAVRNAKRKPAEA